MSFDRDYCSLPLPSKDNHVRWHAEINMVIYPFDRRLSVFHLRLLQFPFAIQRQSSLMARRDKYGHLPLLSKTQCLSTETIAVSLCYLETIESGNMQRQIWSSALFVEDSMCFDWDFCSLPFLSRDNQVQWHAKTNMVICPLLSKTQCLSTETIVIYLYPP